MSNQRANAELSESQRWMAMSLRGLRAFSVSSTRERRNKLDSRASLKSASPSRALFLCTAGKNRQPLTGLELRSRYQAGYD